MLKLKLERPLAVFDIESTGINRKADRIIDLAIVKILPKGNTEEHTFRFDPEMPIPPEATAIHGIRNEDVKGCPTFKQLAGEIFHILQDCDLGGYNVLGFDIPMLCEEFTRAGYTFVTDGRRVFDAQRVFHKREPRDLTAALKFYCSEMHLGAHGALEDVLATIRVMEGQYQRYSDLPCDLDALDAYCNPRDPSWVDRSGRLKWQCGEVVVNFGKKQGQKVRDIIRDEPSFIQWMLKNDFPKDTKEILQNALKGTYPPPPAPIPAAGDA
jgi:DNA polymerase-3 subunit epsilon